MPHSQRAKAIAEVLSLGGAVCRAGEVDLSFWEYHDLAELLQAAPSADVQRQILETVVYAEFKCDEQLEYLAHFPEMRVLCLWNSAISGRTLHHCKSLSHLRRLHLANSQVTDQCLVHLAHLQDLKWLDLANTHITDRGVELLSPLRQLEYLELEGTEITDKSMGTLGSLTSLSELVLCCTTVTGVSLGSLASLTRLTSLDLSQTHITDRALSLTQWPPNLRVLNLGQTLAADSAMENLPQRVESLNLFGTEVTDRSIDCLLKSACLKNVILSNSHVSLRGKHRIREAGIEDTWNS